jgi:hypothetical protein
MVDRAVGSHVGSRFDAARTGLLCAAARFVTVTP